MLILKTNHSNNNSNNILNVLFKIIYPQWYYTVIYNDMTRSGFVTFPFRPDAEDSCIVYKPRTS